MLTTERRHHRWWLLGILLLALILRLGAAGLLQSVLDHRLQREFLIEGDANGYWELARHLARGEDYAVHSPPRYVLRMPGFPALLAGSIRLFGESLFAARLILACVGTLACGLVYLLGRRMFDATTGLTAAGLAAVSPVLIGFSVIVLSETAFAATLLLNLIVGHGLLRIVEGQGTRAEETRSEGEQENRETGARIPVCSCWAVVLALLTGGCVALGCMMRPSWILAGPLFAGMLIIAGRPRWSGAVTGGLVVLGIVLTLLPWGIRNQRVTGHFTLTTFWMGPSLYDGLNPDATGDSNMRFFDRDALSHTMTEYEVDQYYRRQAWEFVKDHPGRTLQLAAAKLWRYWKPWPNAAQFDTLSARLAVSIYFLPVLLLAGMGIWHCKNDIWSIVICVGPILYFAALHAVFVSSLRYRLPAEYPLLVMSAVGIQVLWGRMTRRPAGDRSTESAS